MGKCSKDRRDIYYRLAKEEGWRARSAFKLMQINEQFQLFNSDTRYVVDLCAAPGSWSQVLVRLLPQDSRIVAVDLQEMAPIDGVNIICADITEEQTVSKIISALDGEKADVIVCDGAPDVTGLHDLDEFIQHRLLTSALDISLRLLKSGGTFVGKMFRGKDSELVYEQFREHFSFVFIAKPRSSRISSLEAFVVARNFNNAVSLAAFPSFVLCGSNEEDCDTIKALQSDHVCKDPVQPPINAPYSEARELKRSGYFDSNKLHSQSIN